MCAVVMRSRAIQGHSDVALFSKGANRNASRRSDIAYVAQSLRRLRFPGNTLVISARIFGRSSHLWSSVSAESACVDAGGAMVA